MFIRFALALLTAFLSGCATTQAYSDATTQERKSYITCAVTRAFLNVDHSISPQEVALAAISRCTSERQAVYAKLVAENSGKLFAMSFIDAYMNELHTVMLEHIALRLTQTRNAMGT